MIERQIGRKGSNAASRRWRLAYRDVGSRYAARYVSRRCWLLAVGCWLLAVQLGRTAFGYCIYTQGYMSIDVSVTLDLGWGIILLC